MEQKEFKIGNWLIWTQGDTVTVQNELYNLAFIMPAGELNDLIVGLLVINPGPNPELYTSSGMASELGASGQTGARWFELGLVPGAMVAQEARYKRYVVPKAALPAFERPRPGNPAFGKQA